MNDTIRKWLEGIAAQKDQWSIGKIVNPIGDRYSTQPLRTAGLAITSGGATTAKIGSADFYAAVKGRLVKIAASEDMPALVGSITATKFNVFAFFVDQAGTTSVAMGTEGAALVNVVFPPFPENKALVGFIIVTYGSTFVGGTTPLDTATTVYVSPLGPFDPSVLLN